MNPRTLSPALAGGALVTGGAQRLGRAIALALGQAGFAVAVHYHASAAAADATVADIRAAGGRAEAVSGDLTQESDTAGLVAQAQAAVGPLGVLVNNASVFERDEWDTADRASWDAHMEPNLRAPFVLAQAFARALPPGAEGVVINMLDERVWSVTPHFISYTVSKAGLWALTQSLALAFAPRIRVNAIGPGPALPSPRQTPEQFARQCAATPLRRGTGPDEVARAALAILALPSMTGQMIALDGGQHLQWSPASHQEPEE
jgi:NAD(P)-dependent dehydrogenase (short-subunit alcohol dehydrogenase family)